MKILVTGGAGFIGSHLCERLLDQEHELFVVDDLSTGRYENISSLVANERFHFIVDSILNSSTLERLMINCDLVYHLAASVGVKRIVERPVETIETNVLGSHTVLSLAAKYHRKVILFSTSEVYGKNSQLPFNEEADCVFGPTTKSRWSYGCTKALDEFLGLAYHKEMGLPIVIVRVFNMVGPRQSGQYGMVVPNFVRQALRNQPITVFGDGTQTRCFTYVMDLIEGLTRLQDRPDANGQIYNIGSTESISILDLAKTVKKATSSKSEIIFIPYDKAYEEGFEDMQRRKPDISKIHATVGYKPSTSLDESLAKIIVYEKTQL
ncbi:GDP-mannose 4,6-dehydratase [bacterium]|nr:GDP-mannose 4,6-dehydratase [bacterium]